MFYPTKPGSAALYKQMNDDFNSKHSGAVGKRLGSIMSQERPQFEEIKRLASTSKLLIKDCQMNGPIEAIQSCKRKH